MLDKFLDDENALRPVQIKVPPDLTDPGPVAPTCRRTDAEMGKRVGSRRPRRGCATIAETMFKIGRSAARVFQAERGRAMSACGHFSDMPRQPDDVRSKGDCVEKVENAESVKFTQKLGKGAG